MKIERIYTIKDLAQMTMFSTRTIRNYMKMGLLKGEKIEGEWRFSDEAIETFFSEPYIEQGLYIKRNALVNAFISSEHQDKGCFVYDHVCTESIGEKLCNRIMEAIQEETCQSVQFCFSYNKKKQIARIIMTGDMKWIAQIFLKYIEDK